MSDNKELPELPAGYQVVPHGGCSWCISKNYEYIHTAQKRVKVFRSPEKAAAYCWKDASDLLTRDKGGKK